ncbi:hypothetical protein ACFXHA_33195 [Nocardia sp. NPDC059240]|uniref:hypothetical protein n=1 Tax=Nocardia sp. NPDC059240 TaxID=3346786 RepID=UPI0036910E2D
MRNKSRLRAAAAILLLAVAGCGSTPAATPGGTAPAKGSSTGGSQPDYTPTGKLVADSGFRPAVDGFGFQNYGNDSGPINLTANTMRALFGDAVCASTQGDCELIPQAETWMAEQNKGMANGHCYGMSVTSLLVAMHKLDPAKYGADSTVKLDLAHNAALQEMIAQQFVGQWMPNVVAGQVKGSPKQIVDKLTEVLKPGAAETYSVGFYKRDMTGGHEVTPYAIEDKGNGQSSILIYDNNFPGVTSHIDVDRNADTWRYQTASNPADPSEPYDGDAGTATLMLDPTTPAQQQQTFPYLVHDTKGAKGAKPGGPALTVFLDSDPVDHGHLLITADGGKRIGYVNGKRINEIPGARFVDVKSNNSTYKFEPEYQIPAGTHFTVTVDGAGLKKTQKSDVVILGGAFDVSVGGINLAPGATSTIDMGIDGDRVKYTSTDAQAPDIEIGESYDSSDYAFAVSKAAVGPGGTVEVTLPLDRNVFTVDATKSRAPASLGVTMERIDDHGKRTFSKDGVAVSGTATAAFDFDAWDGGGKAIALTVTDQGKKNTTQLPAN